MQALSPDSYDVRDIFVDKQGAWYMRGLPTMPGYAFTGLDVLVNALHGGEGEDGRVARMATRAGVPITGSGALGSLQSLNKALARDILRRAGVPMPRAIPILLKPNTSIDLTVTVRHIFDSFAGPYIIKPLFGGASHGISVAAGYFNLGDVLAAMLDHYEAVLVEEYIRGQEATVGIIQDFRNESLYALPPAELHLPTGHQFMPSSSYREGQLIRVPAPMISYQHKQDLMRLAKLAHQTLGLEHYSRADFLVTPRGPVLLEVNALPGLYEGASMPTMLEVVGANTPQLVEHAVQRELALA